MKQNDILGIAGFIVFVTLVTVLVRRGNTTGNILHEGFGGFTGALNVAQGGNVKTYAVH